LTAREVPLILPVPVTREVQCEPRRALSDVSAKR
jgi:hypothetical protein